MNEQLVMVSVVEVVNEAETAAPFEEESFNFSKRQLQIVASTSLRQRAGASNTTGSSACGVTVIVLREREPLATENRESLSEEGRVKVM